MFCLPLPGQHLRKSIAEIVGEPILGIRLLDVDEWMWKGSCWAPDTQRRIIGHDHPNGSITEYYHGIAVVWRNNYSADVNLNLVIGSY